MDAFFRGFGKTDRAVTLGGVYDSSQAAMITQKSNDLQPLGTNPMHRFSQKDVAIFF
jgi:hypothetical protein